MRRERSGAFHVEDADTKTMTELLEQIAKQESVTAEINKLEADKDRIKADLKFEALVDRINNPTPIVSARIKRTIQEDGRAAKASSLKELQENKSNGHSK